MFIIRILTAEEGKIYTNGKLKGKVVWVPDEEDIKKWYQIADKETPKETK